MKRSELIARLLEAVPESQDPEVELDIEIQSHVEVALSIEDVNSLVLSPIFPSFLGPERAAQLPIRSILLRSHCGVRQLEAGLALQEASCGS